MILDSGVVERNFKRNEFVIEINEAYEPLNNGDKASFFIRNEDSNCGISEQFEDSSLEQHYWKLAAYDGFIQAYKSADGKIWENIGGVDFKDDILYQGFEVEGESSFKLNTYRVYSSPYLKIYNYPEGYKAVLEYEDGTTYESLFTEKNIAFVFINYCCEGRIKIYDKENELLFETDTIQINYGDEYIRPECDLDLIYRNEVLGYKTTKFYINKDLMTLRNNSNKNYENIMLIIDKPESNTDEITISLDNENFYNSVTIDLLEGNSSIDFWVLHERKNRDSRYEEFSIEII